jgi:hypothetical protein
MSTTPLEARQPIDFAVGQIFRVSIHVISRITRTQLSPKIKLDHNRSPDLHLDIRGDEIREGT